MGRAGRSGGGRSSSGSRSRGFSSSSSKSNFSGGWRSGPSKSRSTSSSTTSSSRSNFSGGWGSGTSTSQRSSSQRSGTSRSRVSYGNTYTDISSDVEVGTRENNKGTVYNSTIGTNQTNQKNKSSMGCGCLLMIIVFIFAILLSNNSISNDGNIESTIERTALDSSLVTTTQTYCYDDLDWIIDSDTLLTGMNSFYSQTGVQPVLIITDNINGNYRPNNDEAEEFMTAVYDNLFDDEGHMLVLFLEAKEEHATWIYCGEDAATVVDEEARDILLSNIEYEYYSDKTEEQMFADAFADTGNQIMEVNKNYITEMFIAIFIIFSCVFFIDKRFIKNSTSSQMDKIPSTVIEVPTDKVEEEVVVECTGCGAKNKLKAGQVSKCEYCDTPLKG